MPQVHQKVISLEEFTKGKIQGFIAIHSTTLGPAVGGTRIFPYKTKNDAYDDALRLSEAMTYKCAISRLPFGGGKGVIIGDPDTIDMHNTLREYVTVVNSLDGQFYTGEDVGLTEEHVQFMLKFSPYFIGKSNQAGDPSKYAALSVFRALNVAANFVLPRGLLLGRTIAIRGLGKTGSELLKLVLSAGMSAYVADTNMKTLKQMQHEHPEIIIVPPDRIHAMEVDVYAPCALGPDITELNVPEIKAKIVIGTANNQLENEKVSQYLLDRGILYIPDFLANAGGLINVADELLPGGYDLHRVLGTITRLDSTTEDVVKESITKKVPTDVVAKKIVEQVFQKSY